MHEFQLSVLVDLPPLDIPIGQDLSALFTQLLRFAGSLFGELVFFFEVAVSVVAVLALLAAGWLGFLLYRRHKEGDGGIGLFSREDDEEHLQSARMVGEERRPLKTRVGVLDYLASLEVLGLKKGASMAQIKSAHRRLVKEFHPDTGGDEGEFSERKYLLVQKAYKKLLELEAAHGLVSDKSAE